MSAPLSSALGHQLAGGIAHVGGLLLLLLSQTATATEVLVVTDSRHPVHAVAGARVIELDRPGRIEAELAAGLPANPEKATAIVQRRLHDGGAELQRRMKASYQDVAEAWGLGIAKVPAVVLDRRYVVYGDPDVGRAVARIDARRRTQP